MSTMQELIDSRSKDLVKAYDSANIDQLMSFFTSDVVFSDYVFGAVDLDYSGLHKLGETMYSITGSLKAKTVATTGTSPEFVTWESELSFTSKVDDEKLGVKTGESVTFKGVAIQHWREEGNGDEKKWKIFKEADYFLKM